MSFEGRAIVAGRATSLVEARLALTDDGAVRGDGAFETIGVWDGRPFRLAQHLERLVTSLAALQLPPPDRVTIEGDVAALLDGFGGDGMLRVYVTAAGTHATLLAPPPIRVEPTSLWPLTAPWIRPVGSYGLAAAKTMSYGPNMAATRLAQAAGADDALLLATEGWVLEGPTFCVLWVVDGSVRAAALELGVVDSVSRGALLELAEAAGLDVLTGRWLLHELGIASEVMICSAVRPVIAIRRIGELAFDGPTLLRDRLARDLEALRRTA